MKNYILFTLLCMSGYTISQAAAATVQVPGAQKLAASATEQVPPAQQKLAGTATAAELSTDSEPVPLTPFIYTANCKGCADLKKAESYVASMNPTKGHEYFYGLENYFKAYPRDPGVVYGKAFFALTATYVACEHVANRAKLMKCNLPGTYSKIPTYWQTFEGSRALKDQQGAAALEFARFHGKPQGEIDRINQSNESLFSEIL